MLQTSAAVLQHCGLWKAQINMRIKLKLPVEIIRHCYGIHSWHHLLLRSAQYQSKLECGVQIDIDGHRLSS